MGNIPNIKQTAFKVHDTIMEYFISH